MGACLVTIIQNLKLNILADNTQFRSTMLDTANIARQTVAAITSQMQVIESLGKSGAGGRFQIPKGIAEGAGKFADQGRAAQLYNESLQHLQSTIDQAGRHVASANGPFLEMAQKASQSFRTAQGAAEKVKFGNQIVPVAAVSSVHEASTAMMELSAAGVVAHAETKNAAAGVIDFGAKLTAQRAIIRDTTNAMGLQTEQLIYSALGFARIAVQANPAIRAMGAIERSGRAVGNVVGGLTDQLGAGVGKLGAVFADIGGHTGSTMLVALGSSLERVGTTTQHAGQGLSRVSGGAVTLGTVAATTTRISQQLGDTMYALAMKPLRTLSAGAVSAGNSLVGLAARFGLINYNVRASMDTWNALAVMKGPGKLVMMFDRMNSFIHGSIPPIRQVAFIVKQFLVPAFAALAEWLTRIGNDINRPNPAIMKLGHSFAMLAHSVRNVGAGSQVHWLLQVVGGVKLFTTHTYAAVAAAVRLSAGLSRLLIVKAVHAAMFGLTTVIHRLAVGMFSLGMSAARAVTGLFGFRFATSAAAKAANETAREMQRAGLATSGAGGLAGMALSPFQKMKSLFKEWAPTIFGVTAGIAGVAAAVKGLAGGFKSAATFEQWDVAFGTMLGDADKAKTVLKDIEDFSAATPFRMPELVTSARNLLAFQVTADQLIPTLRVVGDLAAGAAQPIGDIADIYGKMKGAGAIGNDFLMELQNRGIPILNTLAKEFNTTTLGIKKLAEDGKLAFPDVQEALIKLTGVGGQFSGMMEKQSTTVNGLLSTLADNFSLSFKDIAAGIMKSFGVLKLLDWFTQLTGFVRTSVVPVIVGSMDWMSTMVSNGIQGVWGFFSQYWGAIAELGMRVWQGLGEGWAAVVGFIVPLGQTALTFIGDLFKSVFGVEAGKVFTSVQEGFVTVFSIGEWAIRNWRTVFSIAFVTAELAVVKLGGILAHFFTVAAPAYLNWFGNNWIKVFADIGSFTATVFTNMWKNISNFFTAMWNFVANRGKGTEAFKFAWTPLLDGFKATMAELPTIAERQMGPLEKIITTELADMKKGALGDMAGFIEERLKGFQAAVVPAALAAKAELPKFLEGPKMDVGKLKLDDRMLKPEHNFENRALQRGSAEAFSAVSRADARNKVTGNGIQKIADLAGKQVDHLQGVRNDVHILAQNATHNQIRAAKL